MVRPSLSCKPRIPLGVVVAGAVAAFAAAPAGAATTNGDTSGVPDACGGAPFTEIQARSGPPPAPTYRIGGEGVITSWHTRGNGLDSGDVKLKVFGPGSGAHEYVVRASDLEFQSSDDSSSANVFPVRIPVSSGERLGLTTVDGDPACSFAGVSGDVMRESTTDDPVGSSTTTTTSYDSTRVNVSATVEPDRDNDGYGDETQDGCPSDPTMQAACQADLVVTETAGLPVVKLGGYAGFTVSVTNTSHYNAARGVTVTDPLSPGLRLAPGVSPVISLGDIRPGATHTARIGTIATGTGVQTDSATATSATVDPNAANNSASAATNVLVPFAGMPLQALAAKVKHGKAQLRLTCPATAYVRCDGAAMLDATVGSTKPRLAAAKKKKGKTVRLGSGKFSIPAGKTMPITIKLGSRALQLLKRQPKLKARETVSAQDLQGTTIKTSSAVTLKR